MRTLIGMVGAGILFGAVFPVSGNALAQTVRNANISADSAPAKATISFLPRTGSFTEGSTFEVSIVIDTQGESVNAAELHIRFDPKKLQIIEPAGQQSVIGLWVETPTYSNTVGTLKLVGAIPGGITTKSGLLAKITFKALTPGSTRLTILPQSQVLANDGLGTAITASFGSASYTIILEPPEGPKIFSETHPFPDHWYNNNTPVMAWEKDPGVADYSFVVDDKPFTVPDNIPDTTENRISLPDLPNGISYFHIKARKGTVWGGTTHFLIRIDNVPPADFTPTYERLSSGRIQDRVFVSFFTTDSLSGIDHYEIGVIDTNESPDISPVFVQAQSPFQLPSKISGDMRVMVRVVDKAGNVRDKQLTVAGFSVVGFMKENAALVVAVVLFIVTVWVLVSYYVFTRRVSRALGMATRARLAELDTPQYRELPPPKPFTYVQEKSAQPDHSKLDVLTRQAESSSENRL